MKDGSEAVAGVGARVGCDLFGSAGGEDLAVTQAAYGVGGKRAKQEVCAALIFGSQSV